MARFGYALSCEEHPPDRLVANAVRAEEAGFDFAMISFVGVGTGEALNEHILGDDWPPAAVRREMLEEAVEVIASCGRAR